MEASRLAAVPSSTHAASSSLHRKYTRSTHTRWPAATAADPGNKNLEHNFAGFAPIEHFGEFEDRTLASQAVLRSESRAPKTRKCTLEAPLESQSDPQILFRGLRGVPKTSLGGPRENFGTPIPLGGRVRTCGLQRNAHSLGAPRKPSGDATSRFCPPAPRAQNS